MKLKNLTEAIELVKAMGGRVIPAQDGGPAPTPAQSMIGKYVIVRSSNEGINAGVVKLADDTGVVLTDARRIWYHRPKDESESWYEGDARTGVSTTSKLSGAVGEKAIIERYSMTVCTPEASASIKEATTHAQS